MITLSCVFLLEPQKLHESESAKKIKRDNAKKTEGKESALVLVVFVVVLVVVATFVS